MRITAICLCVALTTILGEAQSRRASPPAPVSISSFDVMEKPIADLQAAMTAGTITSRQLVEIFRARITAYDKQGPAINAMVNLNPQALATADALDAERKAGRVRGPLHGIPIVVKDNYETLEMSTTAGSIALFYFHPASDAFQVKRLRDAGTVIVGKTNMHELAAGITTISSSGGQTKNPYDLDRNPGGSSGGTGAAIATNFAVGGMGSDTCGSIRNPASHNNLVGLRGTHGLSSRTGIVPLSTTQDIGGPLARTITDLAILLDATVGPDPADPVTRNSDGHIPKSYLDALSADALKGKRIGVVRSLFGNAPEDGEVTAVVQKSLDAMKESGAEVIDVVIPGLDDLLRDSSLIASEFKFDLADYLGRHPSAPVKSLGEILNRGLYHAALETTFRARNAPDKRESDQQRRAVVKRAAIRHAVLAVLEEHRLAALVYPTLRRKPARLGDAQAGSNCTLSAHSALPALGIPAGFTDDGLPVGIDLLGSDWSEPQLLALGYAYEHAIKPRRAPFSTPALVGGRAPTARRLTTPLGELVFDESTSVLTYRLDPARLQQEQITAVWMHRRAKDGQAAAIHQLFDVTGPSTTGAINLSYRDRRDLTAGNLIVRPYARPGTPASVIELRFGTH